MPRALFSVSNKINIIELGQILLNAGWDIVASGGTAKTLIDNGITVTPVEQVTGFPEMLGGRVKTLHPAIHAPILARDHQLDFAELTRQGYAPIDLVVCNLYPFQKTVADPQVAFHDAIEQIDIGGVALLRAAAKNFERVMVVCDPEDYAIVQAAVKENQPLDLASRRRLAAKAFAHTCDYDSAIHTFLAQDHFMPIEQSTLSEAISLHMVQSETLRYGENPHQKAALYSPQQRFMPLGGEVLQGKALSYNNLLDADAAWRAVSSFAPEDGAAVVIVKHLNPVGVAVGDNLTVAFERALASDAVSAFGGVIAVNHHVNLEFVQALGTLFVEVIIAPDFDLDAANVLQEGRKNCRLLKVPRFNTHAQLEMRSILGGLLVQEFDLGDPKNANWEVVSQRHPEQNELLALQFAWKIVSHVKSNAIVIANQFATLGIGGGLPSRVDAVALALDKAGDRAKGAVLASDAFFPFADGVELAINAGIRSFIQPGGSIRDKQIIEAVNGAGATMIFTHIRHFRH